MDFELQSSGVLSFDNKLGLFIIEPNALVFEGIKNTFQSNVPQLLASTKKIDSFGQATKTDILLCNFEKFSLDEMKMKLKTTNFPGRILFYSLTDNEITRRVAALLATERVGGVLIQATPELLIRAVNDILNGHKYICAKTASLVREMNQAVAAPFMNAKRKSLTQREEEILKKLASGRSNKEVAAELNISVRTVETHRSRIMTKINAGSFADLVRYALMNNYS